MQRLGFLGRSASGQFGLSVRAVRGGPAPMRFFVRQRSRGVWTAHGPCALARGASRLYTRGQSCAGGPGRHRPFLAAGATLTAVALAVQPRSTTWLLSNEDMSLDMIINEQQAFEEQLRIAHQPPEPQPLLVGWFRWLTRNLLLWGGVLLTGTSVVNVFRRSSSKAGSSKLHASISIGTGLLCAALGLTWTVLHQLRHMLYLDNHEQNMRRYEERLTWRSQKSLPFCMQESCEFALQFLNSHKAAQELGFEFQMMPNVNVSTEFEEERVHMKVYVAARHPESEASLHVECIEAVNHSKTMDISAQSISDLIFPDVGKRSYLHLVFSRERNDVVRVHLKDAAGEFACSENFDDGVSFTAVEDGRIVNSTRFFRDGVSSRAIAYTAEKAATVQRHIKALLLRESQTNQL